MPNRELVMPWDAPKLSPNKRIHWAQRGKLTAEVRHTTRILAKAAKIGPQDHVSVELHYRPCRNWRLDEDNLVGDLKASCDGLVDAGIVPDDTPRFMAKAMPILHAAERGESGRLWLSITWGVRRRTELRSDSRAIELGGRTGGANVDE